MKVLEDLRFEKVARLLVKHYRKGDIRHIRKRMYSGFVFCLGGKTLFKSASQTIEIDEHHVMMAPKDYDYDVITEEDATNLIVDFVLSSGFYDRMYVFEINEVQSFLKTYQVMEKQYLFSSASHELMGLAKLYDLTARINGYGKVDNRYKAIEAGERFLEANVYDQKLNITDIAKAANISEVYFRRLFKEKYNMSPYEYINEIRIKKAKDALLYDDDNISEIARECGFYNIYTFSRAFKKTAGLSPSEFKKKHIVSE